MKLEITKKVEKKEIIDVNLPYYYHHNLLLDHADSVIYGKIEKDRHKTIQKTVSYYNDEINYEVEIEETRPSLLSCYFEDEYKSDKETYESMRRELAEVAKYL